MTTELARALRRLVIATTGYLVLATLFLDWRAVSAADRAVVHLLMVLIGVIAVVAGGAELEGARARARRRPAPARRDDWAEQ